jgi:hypothetical protein
MPKALQALLLSPGTLRLQEGPHQSAFALTVIQKLGFFRLRWRNPCAFAMVPLTGLRPFLYCARTSAVANGLVTTPAYEL